MAISKRDKERMSATEPLVAEACTVMLRYPMVWEFLTATVFSDGSPRTAPTLLFYIDGKLLKACLNDRAEGLVAFASGSSLTAILEALEAGLAEDTLDWRKSQNGQKRR